MSVTRREFVKTAGAVAAGASLVPAFAESRKLRYAVLGTAAHSTST